MTFRLVRLPAGFLGPIWQLSLLGIVVSQRDMDIKDRISALMTVALRSNSLTHEAQVEIIKKDILKLSPFSEDINDLTRFCRDLPDTVTRSDLQSAFIFSLIVLTRSRSTIIDMMIKRETLLLLHIESVILPHLANLIGFTRDQKSDVAEACAQIVDCLTDKSYNRFLSRLEELSMFKRTAQDQT